jgi:hypothetical protein
MGSGRVGEFRVALIEASETIPLHGVVDIWSVRGPVAPAAGRLWVPDDAAIDDHFHGRNLICTAGYTALCAALTWSGVQDQAPLLSLSASNTYTFLTPLWGAVGNGTPVTPAKTDTQLVAELGRVTISGGASLPASSTIPAATVWQFFYSQPATSWTVTEAGVFANGTSAANTGTMVNHLAISPTVSIPTTNTGILQVSLQLGP